MNIRPNSFRTQFNRLSTLPSTLNRYLKEHPFIMITGLAACALLFLGACFLAIKSYRKNYQVQKAPQKLGKNPLPQPLQSIPLPSQHSSSSSSSSSSQIHILQKPVVIGIDTTGKAAEKSATTEQVQLPSEPDTISKATKGVHEGSNKLLAKL